MKGVRGLDNAFQAEETRKSDLILQASLLREQREDQSAAMKFAEAAAIEEHLRDRCREQGLIEKSFVHAFSAASCWAQAGDFHHSITLCRDLLAHSELPERLRQRVQEYVETLCARRAEWYAELMRVTAGVEG